MERITLEFNHQQMSVISEGLVGLPYRVSAPVIEYINQQIMQQAAAAEISERSEQEKV